MIQLEQQQHGEFWVGGVVGRVGNTPTTYIQLTLWLDQKQKNTSNKYDQAFTVFPITKATRVLYIKDSNSLHFSLLHHSQLHLSLPRPHHPVI